MTLQQILEITKDDVVTVTGKNKRYILTELDQSDISQLKKSAVKKEYKFAKLQPFDEWKIPSGKDLTDVNQRVQKN